MLEPGTPVEIDCPADQELHGKRGKVTHVSNETGIGFMCLVKIDGTNTEFKAPSGYLKIVAGVVDK